MDNLTDGIKNAFGAVGCFIIGIIGLAIQIFPIYLGFWASTRYGGDSFFSKIIPFLGGLALGGFVTNIGFYILMIAGMAVFAVFGDKK